MEGLRREEVAALAGMSLSYYIRLEQGEATTPSEQVTGSLARALRLDADTTTYLYRIAGIPEYDGRDTPASTSTRHVGVPVGFPFHEVVSHIDAAAIALNHRNDVLAANGTAESLFFSHLRDPEEHHFAQAGDTTPLQINTHRLLFTDPTTRDMFVDWEAETSLAVASLRFHSAAFPDDPDIRALVNELHYSSDRFATLWDAHPVQRCTHGTKLIRPLDPSHRPGIERLFDYHMLHSPEMDGHRIIVYREHKRPRTFGTVGAHDPDLL